MKYITLAVATMLFSVPVLAQDKAAEVISKKTDRGLPSDAVLTNVAGTLSDRAIAHDSTRRDRDDRIEAARKKAARIKAARIKAAREDAANRPTRATPVRPAVSMRPVTRTVARPAARPAQRPATAARPATRPATRPAR